MTGGTMTEQERIAELERQLNWLRSLLQSACDDAASEQYECARYQKRATELERELADATRRAGELQAQLDALRKWAQDVVMVLRSLQVEAEVAERHLPEGTTPHVSPEQVCGILGDLGGMTPEDYLHHLYDRGQEPTPEGGGQ